MSFASGVRMYEIGGDVGLYIMRKKFLSLGSVALSSVDTSNSDVS